ncbi:FtsX-like permease family protein [Actinoplanes utahensis]|uniref:ABC3 transporter permease C-terminal domain-containing protein n=1 Tax=Actinoplanes utahensis TaxID=1869 RepID=A0A0A6UAG6_ACTUT|nr:FtsX-like permease family protein [Actinoplanes utahensis]KHD72058.1 hypothetical protein MB27_42175 [Actinoplanes utahensis]GIF28793.1 hypothetical protein Aut01nite_17790 [Actinoplanes utahensis]
MISLVLAMLWRRRGQAGTLALLSLLAVASAVAAPAYLIAAERAVAAGQIETAATSELTMVTRRSLDSIDDPSGRAGIDFPDAGKVLLNLNGFTYYHSAEVPAVGLEKSIEFPTRAVYRQGICDHVRIVSGRCPAAEGDALVGEDTARRLGLAAGDVIALRAARQNDLTNPPTWTAEGVPKTMTVSGTYRPVDSTEAYWGLHGYFVGGPGIGSGEPVFTNHETLETMQRTVTTMAIDGIAEPGTIDIDRLDQLRADLVRINTTSDDLDQIQFSSAIPRLLDRIDEGRAAARLLVPVIAVPLVLLACFTIYLTVGYGAEGRQSELAVVALRGTRWWTRWWLATGESLIAVLAGAVAGCLTGQLLVNAAAAALFPGVGADPAFSSLRYAPLAAVAALVAAVVAQRRQLTSSVAGLLRRTPATGRRRVAAAEAVVVVLAIATGAQYALADEPLTGVGMFAPALLVLALALVAARALLPLVNRGAVAALHRGRLGFALAGLQLSRRPGAGRLFALLVAAAAVAGYAASAVDTAARGREVEAMLGTGADRVLTVNPVTKRKLIDAVRAVDPDGRFAMAAVKLPAGAQTPPGYAVDSERLATVAAWPEDGPDPDDVHRLLHPRAADPPLFTGPEITADITYTSGGAPLRLTFSLSSTAGLGDGLLQLGELRPGTHTYRHQVALCAQGCRLNALSITGGDADTPTVSGQVVIRGLNTGQPAPLTDPARWRPTEEARLSAAPDGLRADVTVPADGAVGAWIQPVATPYPVPMAYAGRELNDVTVTGVAPAPVPLTPVAALPAVPAAGRQAALVELDYLDVLSAEPKEASEPQVWLNAAAPADIADRLAGQGLSVASDAPAATVRAGLDRQGPAVALWFHLIAAVLAGLLGAGALALTVAVDRTRRAEDLTALRIQGLRRGPASQATLWTYPVLVTIATGVGVLVALAAWRLTGWALPLAGLTPPDLPLPTWPRPSAVLAAAGTVLVVEFLVALFSGRNLRRRIERP